MSKAVLTQRQRWIDSAKGLAILLVVMWHLYLFYLHPALAEFGPAGLSDRVSRRMHLITPVRMPLFFLLSGALAAKLAVTAWPGVFRRRTLHFYYLYLVWVSIFTVIYVFHPEMWNPPTWESWAQSAVFRLNSLWYLWALAVFYPLAKLLAKTPRIGLIAAVLASVTIGVTYFPAVGALTDVPKNFVWFFAGFVLSGAIKRFAVNKQTSVVALFTTVIWVTCAWAGMGKDQLYFLLIAACAVFSIIFIMVWANEKLPKMSRGLEFLGKRTISIYVLHVPVLWYATLAMPEQWSPTGVLGAFAFLVLGSPVVAGTALLIGTGLRTVLPWLFAPPFWLVGKRPASSKSPDRTFV